VIVFDTMQD